MSHTPINTMSTTPGGRNQRLVARALRRLVIVALSALVALSAVACEKDARALVNEGNVSVINKKYDQAVVSFEAALAKEPGNFDAVVGLAETYLRKGDLAKSREYFEQAKKSKLSKAQEQFLNQKFQDLLLSESEGLKDKDPEKYEAKLREVIEVKNKGRAADDAYFSLGEFYMKRGDDMAKDKKTRDKAVDFYEQMKTIRTQPALRKQALDKAKKLRREIFTDVFANELARLTPELEKDSRLDKENKRVKVIAAVEDKELNPKTDEDKEVIRKQLSRTATTELIRLTYSLSGTPTPESVPNAFAFKTAKVEEEVMEKGKAQLTVSVTLDELENLAYVHIVAPLQDKKKDEDDKKIPAEGGEEKKEEAADAGADAGGAAPDAKPEDADADAGAADKDAAPAP